MYLIHILCIIFIFIIELEGPIMETTIKKIEDMSLNAWPSYKMELYDGWILRFSHFYTHRTNSVEQFGASSLPWREKIPYCEHEYQRDVYKRQQYWCIPVIEEDLISMLKIS